MSLFDGVELKALPATPVEKELMDSLLRVAQ